MFVGSMALAAAAWGPAVGWRKSASGGAPRCARRCVTPRSTTTAACTMDTA